MEQIYFSERVYLKSGWARDVKIVVHDGVIKELEVGAKLEQGWVFISGPIVPAMANLHSHAFQRVMAGMTEVCLDPEDSFWSWRDLMYKIVSRLSPDQARIIATQLYIDMLKAGYTQVAEFHYLHHDVNGARYENLAEMASQLSEAAKIAGLGLTLLPTLYTYSGFAERKHENAQRRFINTTDDYLRLHRICSSLISDNALNEIGIAFHSLRAVAEPQIHEIISALDDQIPIHIHIAEQQKEVSDCLQWSDQRPVQWLYNHVDVDSRWCLVHATHLSHQEINTIAASRAVVGLCPSTEANLGDGIFPAVDYVAQAGVWGIGSDSHMSLSIVDELRTLEYSQRLRDQKRNRLHNTSDKSVGDFLFKQARLGGNRASGVKLGLELGSRADFLVLDDEHPFICSSNDEDILNRWLFACNENLVKHVYVAGQAVVENFRHSFETKSRNEFSRVVKALLNS